MDPDKIKKYEARVSTWLSKQSVFYQVLNGWKVMGLGSAAFAYYFGVIVKLIVILIILGVVGFLYLARQHHDQGYAEAKAERVKASLNAERVSMSRIKGGIFAPVEIASLEAFGGEMSFFNKLKMTNIVMDLGGNVMIGQDQFQTKAVNCNKIVLDARISGAGGTSYSALFENADWLEFSEVTAKSFDCRWGGSERSEGTIERARLHLRKGAEGCEVTITGGKLTFSWFREVDIEKITMVITPTEFRITEALLRRGESIFSLNLSTDKLGSDPVISGGGYAVNCNVDDLIPAEFAEYLDGMVDLRYTFRGSPSAEAGMDFTFQPIREFADERVLEVERKKPFLQFSPSIPVVKALIGVDNTIDYRTLSFNNCQWEAELRGREFIIRDAVLKNDLSRASVQMDFALRSPSQTYIVETLKVEQIELLERPWLQERGLKMLESKKSKENRNAGLNVLEYSDYVKLLETERHFYGQCVINLHERSFTDKPKVAENYPVGENGYRSLKIPLEGHMSKITKGFAQELLYMSYEH